VHAKLKNSVAGKHTQKEDKHSQSAFHKLRKPHTNRWLMKREGPKLYQEDKPSQSTYNWLGKPQTNCWVMKREWP
jgi:hypothetical protein